MTKPQVVKRRLYTLGKLTAKVLIDNQAVRTIFDVLSAKRVFLYRDLCISVRLMRSNNGKEYLKAVRGGFSEQMPIV